MNGQDRIVTQILRKNLALPSGATQNFLSCPGSGAGPLFSTRLQFAVSRRWSAKNARTAYLLTVLCKVWISSGTPGNAGDSGPLDE